MILLAIVPLLVALGWLLFGPRHLTLAEEEELLRRFDRDRDLGPPL